MPHTYAYKHNVYTHTPHTRTHPPTPMYTPHHTHTYPPTQMHAHTHTHPAHMHTYSPMQMFAHTQEMDLLEDDAVIYKLIGPVLVRQELSEARQTVEKRLDYISKEL